MQRKTLLAVGLLAVMLISQAAVGSRTLTYFHSVFHLLASTSSIIASSLANDALLMKMQLYHDNNALRNVSLATEEFLVPASPLNDKTLPWDATLNEKRLWMNLPKNNAPPPAMLLLTAFGWNAVNQTEATHVYRGMRGRELMDGVINHPWFHPTAWQDLNEGKLAISNTTRYYVFLDQDTCDERNYPYYGWGPIKNMDLPGRVYSGGSTFPDYDAIMTTPLFTNAPNTASLIVWDCGGWGPMAPLLQRKGQYGSKLRIVAQSASKSQLHPDEDLGLPPPAVNPCQLTESERAAVEACNETNRTILFGFSGLLRSKVRRTLSVTFRDRSDVLVLGAARCPLCQHFNTESPVLAFKMLAKTSIFGACPRGDNLFSYRFTEQLSCGAIPLVYADDWVWPFSSELVDWKDAGVSIREENASQSVDILEAMSNETRCAMRRKALEVYDKYVRDGRAVVAGVVESLERKAKQLQSA